jgi:hypothetical protein
MSFRLVTALALALIFVLMAAVGVAATIPVSTATSSSTTTAAAAPATTRGGFLTRDELGGGTVGGGDTTLGVEQANREELNTGLGFAPAGENAPGR